MFDDFRKQVDENNFEDEELAAVVTLPPEPKSNRILGMTPPQRFIITFMVLVMTCIIGALILLVTEKIVLPL